MELQLLLNNRDLAGMRSWMMERFSVCHGLPMILELSITFSCMMHFVYILQPTFSSQDDTV